MSKRSYLLSGLYVQSAATTRLTEVEVDCNSLGSWASQSSSRKLSLVPGAVDAWSMLRWTISLASGRSVKRTSALDIVWARAMPTMPQPVPSSRIVKGEAFVECNRVFANIDFVSAKSGIWQARVMPASLQRQPQWAVVDKRCWRRQVYHRCLAMLSPVSSQMAMAEWGDRLKRRWTNLGASSSKVKGALQADTRPRAS